DPDAIAYNEGSRSPSERPAYWSAIAAMPAQIGVATLVPSTAALPPPRTMLTGVPASSATSGTPRFVVPEGSPVCQLGRGNGEYPPPEPPWLLQPGAFAPVALPLQPTSEP